MTRNRSVIGTSLSLLLAATGFCAFTGAVIAAQSTTFMLQEVGPGNGAGVTHGSTNFQMQGDVSWRQEAPLHSNSFSITKDPPAPASSSVPASSTPASSAPTDNSGGGRGNGTTTTNPPVSSAPVSSAPRSSVPASSARPSSAASVSSAVSRSSAASDASMSSDAASSASAASSSSESVRPAAPGGYQEGADPACANTVLCPDPFWHPVNMNPTPSDNGGATVTPSIGEAVVDALEATITACTGTYTSLFLFALFFVLGCLVTTLLFFFTKRADKATRLVWYATLGAAAVATFAFLCVQSAQAAVSSPQRHVYNGHLLNAAGAPITTPHYIRFSEWYSRDMDPTDVSAGVINAAAPTYAGYQEVHVVTPDSQGYFSVELGSGASLPDLAAMDASNLDNLFLQVEVKAAGNPDTSYELLDVNPSDDAVERSPLLSVPFAQNADLLDQREIGTGSGAIPLLGPGGTLPVAVMPAATNQDSFTVDADNTAASEIVLQFGGALAETLKYDIVNDTFEFSADVKINGDLVVTGLINGIDISAISGSDAGKLRASSGAGLTINVTGGSYRINGVVTDYTGASNVVVPANAVSQVFIGSGGLTVRTSGFPLDESFIRIAEVTTNGAGVTQIDDGRVTLADDRELPTEVNMHAEFQNASYQGDAVDNVGQLSVQLDNITQRNFYLWNSTRTTLQDYDVVVRVTLPADFVRWDAAPMSVAYRTTSADSADSKLDVSIFDTNGSPVALGGSATGLASTSWSTTSLTYDSGATWTAGSEFLVKVKLYSKDNYQAHLGSLKLKYIRLAP
jgi:hypothetical protein